MQYATWFDIENHVVGLLSQSVEYKLRSLFEIVGGLNSAYDKEISRLNLAKVLCVLGSQLQKGGIHAD